MADEKKLKNAQSVFATLCKSLDEINWKYERNDEKLIVRFIVNGDDIPMEFIMAVDEERDLVRMLSRLPFSFSEERRVEGAIATCQINYVLADGSFDYDISKGTVYFRLTTSYKGSLISTNVLRYMVECACYTVDKYNDKLLMIEKGMLPIEDFIASL